MAARASRVVAVDYDILFVEGHPTGINSQSAHAIERVRSLRESRRGCLGPFDDQVTCGPEPRPDHAAGKGRH